MVDRAADPGTFDGDVSSSLSSATIILLHRPSIMIATSSRTATATASNNDNLANASTGKQKKKEDKKQNNANTNANAKTARKWGDKISKGDAAALDFSSSKDASEAGVPSHLVDHKAMEKVFIRRENNKGCQLGSRSLAEK